jgi:hypothetical protein
MVIVAIYLSGLIACNEAPINLDYCKMISEDQLHVNNDKSDTLKYKADRAERYKTFKKNFELIMQKTKQEGFPYVSINNFAEDSCKYWAVSMTMIHTAQSNPELFFSKEYADLFKREMEQGNLERELLERSSIITARTMELCNELKPKLEYAIKTWEIRSNTFDEANFINCR